MGLFSRRRKSVSEAYQPELVKPVVGGPGQGGAVFERFQTTRAMPEETIARFRGRVPDAVLDMWRVHGEGFVGDGYLRVLDPQRISPDGVLDPDEGAVALMNTALDDTIFWHGPAQAFICVKWRLGVLDLVSHNRPEDPRAVLGSLGDRDFQERALENRHFMEWLGRGGSVPDLTQGLFYVPAPTIGGAYVSTALEPGGALESQQIYLQFGGGPRLGFQNPDEITPRPDCDSRS
ncbi:GAD-like domain-containing protein [Luteococcus sp. Sow4_B9]|uniref:GAD-like domain-containing protein n=1 Tax=Luteococcus sp. Sow4_B9 TaxID=3438792 RepID=UPI003F9DE633